MDRNDSRTNIRIRLFAIWKQLRNSSDKEFQLSVELWKVVGKADELIFFKGSEKIASVSNELIYLSEKVQDVKEFPIKNLERFIAQR